MWRLFVEDRRAAKILASALWSRWGAGMHVQRWQACIQGRFLLAISRLSPANTRARCCSFYCPCTHTHTQASPEIRPSASGSAVSMSTQPVHLEIRTRK